MKNQKPYILVESDGLSSNTSVFLVRGKEKIALPMVQSASWTVSVKGICSELELRLLNPKVFLKSPVTGKSKRRFSKLVKYIKLLVHELAGGVKANFSDPHRPKVYSKRAKS